MPGPGTLTVNVTVDPVTDRRGIENVLSGCWKTVMAIVLDRWPQSIVNANVPMASSGTFNANPDTVQSLVVNDRSSSITSAPIPRSLPVILIVSPGLGWAL